MSGPDAACGIGCGLERVRFSVVAVDYDGTVASDGVLHPDVRVALGEVRERGITAVLVTGRILGDLQRVAGDLRFVDAVVAENGAVLHVPGRRHSRVLGRPRRQRGRRTRGRTSRGEDRVPPQPPPGSGGSAASYWPAPSDHCLRSCLPFGRFSARSISQRMQSRACTVGPRSVVVLILRRDDRR